MIAVMFEFYDHTADVGMRVRAVDLPGLFAQAAQGLFALIVQDPGRIQPTQKQSVRLTSDSLEDLLHDWLDELLFIFETKHLLLSRFDVKIDGTSLEAEVWGEPPDPARHRTGNEVKAVTYHELKVEKTADGYAAQVILDI